MVISASARPGIPVTVLALAERGGITNTCPAGKIARGLTRRRIHTITCPFHTGMSSWIGVFERVVPHVAEAVQVLRVCRIGHNRIRAEELVNIRRRRLCQRVKKGSFTAFNARSAISLIDTIHFSYMPDT